MARKRHRSSLFTKGHRYTVTHGQVVEPAKTYRGALKLAVTEARTFDAVVHVLERSGRDWTTVATCLPKSPRSRAITCHLKKKPARASR